MKIGAFSPEIRLKTVEAVFEEASRMGFTQMQYDFATSHGEEMPADFHPGELERIASAGRLYGIEILAVNGTFNMIDTDLASRKEHIKRFERIAFACRAFGCGIVTLCTGSRSKKSMWAWDPDTSSEAAWSDLIETTRQILPFAEQYDICLGVETEASNVVCTLERTRRYLDEIGSPRLKVIMDCANLFPAGTAKVENVKPTIRKAFDLLGRDIILAHGKDVFASETIRFTFPGNGIVDYDFYFNLLKEYHYDKGLILHGIHGEEEFEPAIRVMREKLDRAGL